MATLRLNFQYAIQYTSSNTSGSWNPTKIYSGTVYGGSFPSSYYDYAQYRYKVVFEQFPFNIGEYHITRSKLVFPSSCKERTLTIDVNNAISYIAERNSFELVNGKYSLTKNDVTEDVLWGTGSGNQTELTTYGFRDEFSTIIYNNLDKLFSADSYLPSVIPNDGTYADGRKIRVHSIVEIYNVQDAYVELEYEPVELYLTPVYPINVNVRSDRNTNFTWLFTNQYNRSIEDLYATKYEISITQNGETQTFETSGEESSYLLPADTYGAGNTSYKIKVYSNLGTTGESEEQNFVFIGVTSAPEVTGVTQNNYPTITWICDEQKAYELVIKNEFGVVYNSGVVVSEEKSLKLPIMLNDGYYFIEMRALNNFGFYTPWSSYGFTLNPPKPSAVENIIVSANNDFGVSVSCNAETNGTLFVVRRRNEFDYPVVVGEYKKGFVDYTIPLNTPHQYAVRNYVEGYADSEWLDAEIRTEGVVLRDGQDLSQYVHLWKNSEIFDVMSNSSRSDVLINCVGRTYPVKEVGEWITETKTFNSYVDKEDYRKIVNFNVKSHNIYYQANNEFIPCHIEIQDGGEYLGQGRFVSFQLTRIDGE